MKITYIHHSSFLAELKETALLFDYFQGNLSLPEGKPAVVFASHRHGEFLILQIFQPSGDTDPLQITQGTQSHLFLEYAAEIAF